jgi:RES domain-containing protein
MAVELELPDAQIEDVSPSVGARLYDVASCRALGDQWLDRVGTLALSVPSAIVPKERNLVINPLHLLASRIRVLAQESFRFDPRMASA